LTDARNHRPNHLWQTLAFALVYNLVLWGGAGLALLTPWPLDAAAIWIGFILGTALGSWSTFLGPRLGQNPQTLPSTSCCPGCQTPLKRWHQIPIAGYLLLRGRCARCRQMISAHYPLVELAIGMVGALVAWGLLHLTRGS
jgi:hypothetical protein